MRKKDGCDHVRGGITGILQVLARLYRCDATAVNIQGQPVVVASGSIERVVHERNGGVIRGHIPQSVRAERDYPRMLTTQVTKSLVLRIVTGSGALFSVC